MNTTTIRNRISRRFVLPGLRLTVLAPVIRSQLGLWLMLGLAGGLFLSGGCGKSAPAPVEAAPAEETVAELPRPEPAPEPEPIELAELSPITLEPGGQATLELNVTRNGHEGPLQVRLDAVPEGISASAEAIAEGVSTGPLEISADLALGDEALVGSLTVTVAAGELTATRQLALHVPRLNLPTFLPPAEVLLQPGSTRVVEVEIRRDGFQGPLELLVEAPEKLTCKPAPVAAEQDSVRLEITAAADANEGDFPLRLAAVLYGRDLGVVVPVKVEQRPFQVDAFRVVTLAPGQTQTVEVPIRRGSYQGPLQLNAEKLPEGVSLRETVVPAGQDTAILELSATPDAVQHVRSSEIVSTAGHLTTSGPIVIRVSTGDSYLPPAIVANPEIGPLLKRGSIGGRLTAESKQALADFYGGTPESEAAVMRGLKWLATHQQADGSWPLKDYSKNIPDCDCETDFEKEADDSLTAGAAFGVLPFLGAGVTHNRAPNDPPELAEYRSVVEKGLVFLARNQQRTKDLKDKKDGYLGGSMYAHALGTIAFCEAYGLSGDERLKVNAQLAIKYLLNAQHQEGGGWRYSSGSAGDMSVTGWVFLAIRSAQLTGIDVLKPPLVRAERFVDSCAVGPEEAKKSQYAYQAGQAEKVALTAAGLLTRQYLGWRNTEPDLLAGCQYLMQHLPPESGTNLGSIYYHYYATQVLHHMEGEDFDLWNHRMREHLIRSQEKSGHPAGSWNPQGADHGKRGGRLYATSMALLTLQVYYRHLPMYRYVKRS